MLSQIAALVVVILRCITLVIYCRRTIRKTINPTLSTWVLFSIAPSLAFGAYLANGGQLASVENIGNMIDPIANIITLVVVWRYGGVRKPTIPTKEERMAAVVEKCSFAAGGLIVVAWSFTGQHVLANLLLQAIITVAYVPMLHSIWKGKRKEPADLWALMASTAACAFVPAVISGTFLPIFYTVRGTILGSTTLFFVLWDRKRRITRGG